MKIISADKWTPCDGITLEENAEMAIREAGNILVVAGPGAGKTELLAQKASYLFQTNKCPEPKKILAISFKKDAAGNLKERVTKRCGDDAGRRFVSLTYDAFSKSILDHFRFALPEEYRPNAEYLVDEAEIIDAAFKKAGFTNPGKLPQSKLKAYYDKVIASVSLPFSKNDLGEKVWKLLLKGFDDYNSTLSFKMICILSEYIVKTNPQIKRGIQLTYGHIFLDEFQDTTSLQYNLVKQCFLHSNSIMTGVGDNKQRIMLWAGALKAVFEEFKNDFNATEVKLIMNHRSAPRLVELQKMMYSSLEENSCNISVSKKWNPDDGEVSLFITDDDNIEAGIIACDICNKISSGIAPNELCILCKQKPQEYTVQIIAELERNHIRARVENDYQDLIKEPIIEIIKTMLKVSVDRKRPQDWNFISTVIMELFGVDSTAECESYYKVQDVLINKINKLNSLINSITTESEFGDLINNIVSFLGVQRLKAMVPTYGQGKYLDGLLDKFKKYMWEELQIEKFNWLLAIENFEGLHSVPIMTIHKSKGLEYEAVYFIGLEDSAFWNFKNQPEEDRCAFFVALSRAKREMIFTFCNYRMTAKYPRQCHKQINEFFELLNNSTIAKVIECTGNNF